MSKIKKIDIDRLSAENKNLAYLWDSSLPGFGVRCTRAGIKSYVVRYRHNAKQRIKTLGRVEILDISEARDRAKDLLSAVNKGSDPFISDYAEFKNLRELSKAFMKANADRFKIKTKKGYESLWASIIKAIGDDPIEGLDESSIQRLKKELSDRETTFNRAVSLILNSLKWYGIAIETHPFKRTRKFREKPRQRILSSEENKNLYHALTDLKQSKKLGWRYADLFILLLLTGLRRDEWRLGRWEWINWDQAIYVLPDNKTGGRDVYLSSIAITHLKSMNEDQGRSLKGWIFPSPVMVKKDPKDPDSPRHQLNQPLAWTWRIWDKIRHECQLDGFRIHDMRHTAGSMAHSKGGLSQRQVADFLGHNRLETSSRYIHDNEKRESAEAASKAISEDW